MGKLKCIVGVFFLVVFGVVYGEEADTGAEAQAIYTAAQEFMKENPFSAMLHTTSGDPIKYYSKTDADGVNLERMEKPADNGTIILIKNADGSFFIAGNVAVKDDYTIPPTYTSKTTITPSNVHTEYSLKDTEYDGIPCYLVTEKQILSDEAVKHIREQLGPNIVIPQTAIREYVIGKEQPFLYSTKSYDDSGKLIGFTGYTDVKIEKKLSTKLFLVDKDMRIIEAKTLDEYADGMMVAMASMHDLQVSGAESHISRYINGIYWSIALLVAALIAILGVYVYKKAKA